uniref:Pseudouridine synthase n=1 Tax=Candidatus Kentrum sp. FW TaxID=2126338 RepID=A0A450S5K0_9GAMM|nr:MAG: ribosomal large subunit pseudouridine synthase B [Candidatus Kentron sp. FW]
MPYRKPSLKSERKDNRRPSIGKRAASKHPGHHPSKSLPSEKLQKVLAEAGLGSRRLLEAWIEAGRVSVNGVRARLGARVSATDRVRVDGREISRPRPGGGKLRVLRYHKPVGEICSRSDPEERPNVFDRLPAISRGRWIAIGRLDINTCGLLLFTNSGELANRLMHPSGGLEREYAVRVLPWDPTVDSVQPSKRRGADKKDEVTLDASFKRLREGVQLEDGVARFERIIDAGGQGQNHWYHVTIKEGRTHEVRRLWEAVGLKVTRLIRIRYGPVRLERELRPARWEELSRGEIAGLAKSVGLGGLLDSSPSRSQRPRKTDHGKRNATGDRAERRSSPVRKYKRGRSSMKRKSEAGE